MWGIYTMEHYSAMREWSNIICSNMNRPRDDHSKRSKSKTNIIWYHLYVESKKTVQMNLFTKQKWTYGKQTDGYQREKDIFGVSD